MPHPSDSLPRPPGDFADALATPEPVLLVGGQAINLWALYYENRTRNLAPFVSRDVDILGDRQTLTELAKVVGAKPQFFPLKPPTNEIGVVIAHDGTGQPLLVEVLRTVHGVTNEELHASAFTMAIGANQVRVQVPEPIALLKAKIANVSDIAQNGRQDGRHVVILVQLMPAFLTDLISATTQGRITERDLVDRLESLLATITCAKGRKVLTSLRLEPKHLFQELNVGSLSKVSAFLEKRLPRILGS
ncbi:MAG: hypothetical protein ABW223_05390 [Rariglobus sp.]